MPHLHSRSGHRPAHRVVLGALLTVGLGLGVSALAAPATAAGTVPSAPRNVTAAVSGSTVTVRWAAPSSAGSSRITGYSVGYSAGQFGNGGEVAASARTDVFRHLSDGTYSFSVAADNAAGEGKRIFYVVNVGKHQGPSLAASPTVIVAGQQASVFGIWKPGSRITLDRKLPGGTFHAVSTILVARDGSYLHNVTFNHNAVYRTRTGSGLTSNTQRVLVRSRMSLTVVRNATRTYTLAGNVAPASKGQAVTVSYRNGSAWTALGTVHTDASGHWSFKHTYGATQTYTFKVAAAATTLNAPNSVTRQVAVS